MTSNTARLLTVVVMMSLAVVVGCYERVAIPARATPSSARIAMHFEFPDSEQARVRELAEESADASASAARKNNSTSGLTQEQYASQASQVIGAMISAQTDLVTLLTRELPQKGIGHVVRDSAGADLRLDGVTRVAGMNAFVTDWQLIDPKTDEIVRAGTADWGPFPNAGAIADRILTDLVAVDLASYGATPAPAPVVVAPVAPVAPAIPRSTTDGDNAWAVVIGVERYREQLPVATFADNDATAFVLMLEQTLNVPANHIKLLRGDRAARADIASVIEEWLPRNARAKGGRVYVFFSGHGAPDVENGDAYLVPFDADPAYLKTRGYSVKQLYAALGALKDQQTFVFLDACFSGAGDRSVLAAGTRPLVPVKTPKVIGGIVSYAAAQAQQTTGGNVSRAHGLFTTHVLDALSGGADENADGNVDVAELQAYVDGRVETAARLDNREQMPVLNMPAGMSSSSVLLVTGVHR